MTCTRSLMFNATYFKNKIFIFYLHFPFCLQLPLKLGARAIRLCKVASKELIK